MPPSKRSGEESSQASSPKPPRTSIDGDLVGVNRRRSAASSRTGQACDRCKLRKIRCDARIGGCSPCLQNNTECRTTDRITGRATSRGHAENLENENTSLRLYVIELQAQLKEHNVEPKVQPPVPQGYVPGATQWGPDAPYIPPTQHSSHEERLGSAGPQLPAYRAGLVGDNYLGVSSEIDFLSPIEGLSLQLFGARIDLADFMPSEANPDVSPMSYETFLSYVSGKRQAVRPELPDFDSCRLFAEWFLRSVALFNPTLHKPDFMRLLTRIYHEHYQPSPAETVMVHMVLAIVNFQWWTRNGSDESKTTAFAHYHYCLTFVPDLILGHKLEDMQALVMIAWQLRCQPRPGAAWSFTNTVMGVAIEMGLHRSAKAWPEQAAVQQDIELRKRVFWSLLVLLVPLSGRLGRPMPLRPEDFDIEIPEAVNDSLPNEINKSKWKKCSFRTAIVGFKLLKILMQVYSTVYPIKSTEGQYETNIRKIEKELQVFKLQLPAELSFGPQTREEDRIAALFLQMTEAECQLLVHHPSLNRSTSQQVISGNLDICLEASRTLLTCAVHLKELKALDLTWLASTVFLAAIFTTLFVHNQRQDQITLPELHQLRTDMDRWLDVIGEVGEMLGAGLRLRNTVQHIIETSLQLLSNRAAVPPTIGTGAALISATPEAARQDHSQHLQQGHPAANPYYQSHATSAVSRDYLGSASTYPVHSQVPQPQPPSNQISYPSGSHFAYPDGREAPVLQYGSASMTSHDFDTEYRADDTKPNMEGPYAAHHPLQQHQTSQAAHHQLAPQPQQQQAHGPVPPPPPSTFMAAFHSPQHQASNGYRPTNPSVMAAAASYQPANAGPAAWREWTHNTLMPGMDGQNVDYQSMAPANQMMGMNSATNAQGSIDVVAANALAGMPVEAAANSQWPLIHFANPDMGGGH